MAEGRRIALNYSNAMPRLRLCLVFARASSPLGMKEAPLFTLSGDEGSRKNLQICWLVVE